MLRPTRDEFHRLAADHTVVPVWRELLADLITPVAAFARLCGDDQPGFLFESVEHGERWSRWSFVGRNPLATLVLRDGVLEVTGDLPEGMPTDQGILAAVEWMLERYRSPVLDDLPPLHGGLVGYLGYDVVREVEHLPDVPHDATGYPDAVLSVIGQLAAFDHFRQRVTLIDNVLLPDGADEATVDRLYDEALVRLDRLAIDGARPAGRALVEPPDRDPELPEVTARSMRPSSTAWPSRSPRSTSSPATSSRSCCRSASRSRSRPTRSTSTGCCARSTRARTCTSCARPS